MKVRRSGVVLVFICLMAVSWRAGRVGGFAAGADEELRRYEHCHAALRTLLIRFPYAIPQPGQTRLREALEQIREATANWAAAKEARTEIASRARASAEVAMMRILSILDASEETERLSQPEVAVRKRWPAASGVVILRIARAGAEADVVPDFFINEVDLGPAVPKSIEVPQARTVYAFLPFYNIPFGTTERTLRFTTDGKQFAIATVTTEVPAPGGLTVDLIDANSGKASPAVVGLYSRDNRLFIPSEALAFERAGFRYQHEGVDYQPTRVRPYQQVRYWPGTAEQENVFFVDGNFAIELPEGDYTLIVGKGFEYAPQVKTISVQANAEHTETVRLGRWIDMPARGWYSGDGHVHYARESREADERLMVWCKAEDVHVANVMRMGDALQTYFDQYAYGLDGRYVDGDYALVPGQEDPRTSGMGHTLHMNLHAPIRKPDQYYLYDLVFDEVHRQKGLSGYAHVYQPAAMSFWVRRDMTMNVAQEKIDFAEISEFGDIDTQLYYEFLNLGFRLTASAGSDVPWGHSIGTSRVYAYTGSSFDVDSWFRAVRAGNTFVTTGPMLEFTVNGRIPGTEIRAKVGDTLRIKARALGHAVLPRYLEIVSQGDVVGVSRSSSDQKELDLEFSMPVKRSTWLAARCFGAHTTPVYVRVDAARFWKLEKVEELVAIRLKQLDDIEELIQHSTPAGGLGNWNNAHTLRANGSQLLERVALARTIYDDLLGRAHQEMIPQSGAHRQK